MKNLISLFILICCGINAESQKILPPIDYQNSNDGCFELQYRFGNKNIPDLPTILVISDEQQFHVRDESVNNIHDELFGNDLNVLDVNPRSTNKDLLAKIDLFIDGKIDWTSLIKAFYDLKEPKLLLLNSEYECNGE